MKNVDVEQMVRNAVPILASKKERLHYLAKLIDDLPKCNMFLFHNLEHCSKKQLNLAIIDTDRRSVFALAFSDPHLKAAGVGDSIGKQMDYFSLTIDELHEFSCDCGGRISNSEMAKRVRSLADSNKTNFNPGAGFIGRVAHAFGF